MRLELFFLTYVIEWCTGVRLHPLENNDKLQDITNLYVAEWQWESWPVKQDLSEQEGKSPSQRKNAALWKDSSGSAWYLFGGQPVNGDPKKVFSDVWKFTVKTRAWKRLFPTQANIKEPNTNKTGDLMPLLTNLRNEKNAVHFNRALQNLVLCGGLKKSNPNKVKKLKVWNSFRRKLEKDEPEDKLTSLAVYAPKTSKSNTVWQIDAKNKQWTAYTCCCETVQSRNENLTKNSTKNTENKITNKKPNDNETTEELSLGDKKPNPEKNNSKINKIENETEQPSKTINIKSKKRKINQIRNNSDKLYLKKMRIEKRGSGGKNTSEETKPELKISTTTGNNTKNLKEDTTNKKEESSLKVKITSEGSNKTEKSELFFKRKMASKFCPEFTENDTSVTWCDGRDEVILTSDINSPEIVLWMFNLSTSHWSELKVNLSDDIKWPSCSDMKSVRYTGNEEEVYIICSKPETAANKTCPENSTNSSKIPSRDNDNREKLVFKINYKDRVLCDLGNIQLSSHFSSRESEKIWRDESQVILHVIKNSDNETILIMAYLDMVDLWVLERDQKGKESFHLVEKIWRGSALKWFDKYHAALYSLQFVSESGKSETILLPNPRKIEPPEYWPRERGRFIIRVFRNENLKNQSFENRTREQNLTYELLQSDYKPSGSENQLNHVYSLKVLIFFGLSLGIFTIFGTVLFLKRCVNCPPRIRVRNECHKSPLVIRYSVIPDDLLYPMT